MPAPNGDPGADFREAGSHLSLALEPAISMAIWIVGGVLLDQWLDTTPWFLLGGLCIGMVSMFVLLARGVKKSEARSKKRPPQV